MAKGWASSSFRGPLYLFVCAPLFPVKPKSHVRPVGADEIEFARVKAMEEGYVIGRDLLDILLLRPRYPPDRFLAQVLCLSYSCVSLICRTGVSRLGKTHNMSKICALVVSR